MAISMYKASVPVFLQVLHPMPLVLDKVSEFVAEKAIDESVFLQTKLYPEMLPFTVHIGQSVTHATRCCALVAQVQRPRSTAPETTVAGLKDRIAKAIAFLAVMRPEQMDGMEDREVVMKTKTGEMTFTAQQFLLNFSMPNFLFHATSAYNILRGSGIDIGKRDFLGTARRVTVSQDGA